MSPSSKAGTSAREREVCQEPTRGWQLASRMEPDLGRRPGGRRMACGMHWRAVPHAPELKVHYRVLFGLAPGFFRDMRSPQFAVVARPIG
jgi:hypothetical protein